jgi:hypothetical protein
VGVILSLEGTPQARSRKNRGQRSRAAEDEACLEALAAFLRADATSAERCLSRVSKASIAARLLPAARALAHAVDLALSEAAASGSAVDGGHPPSPAGPGGSCADAAAAKQGTTSSYVSSARQHPGRASVNRPQTYSAGIAGHPM